MLWLLVIYEINSTCNSLLYVNNAVSVVPVTIFLGYYSANEFKKKYLSPLEDGSKSCFVVNKSFLIIRKRSFKYSRSKNNFNRTF